MQITAELDHQHIEKLQELEKKLGQNASKLISLAIDGLYEQNTAQLKESKSPYEIMLQTGFIGCLSARNDLSETYKDDLDWDHKL